MGSKSFAASVGRVEPEIKMISYVYHFDVKTLAFVFSLLFGAAFAETDQSYDMVLRQGFTSLLARSVLDAGSGIDQVSISEMA